MHIQISFHSITQRTIQNGFSGLHDFCRLVLLVLFQQVQRLLPEIVGIRFSQMLHHQQIGFRHFTHHVFHRSLIIIEVAVRCIFGMEFRALACSFTDIEIHFAHLSRRDKDVGINTHLAIRNYSSHRTQNRHCIRECPVGFNLGFRFTIIAHQRIESDNLNHSRHTGLIIQHLSLDSRFPEF